MDTSVKPNTAKIEHLYFIHLSILDIFIISAVARKTEKNYFYIDVIDVDFFSKFFFEKRKSIYLCMFLFFLTSFNETAIKLINIIIKLLN